jgi:hypothetical protein
MTGGFCAAVGSVHQRDVVAQKTVVNGLNPEQTLGVGRKI